VRRTAERVREWVGFGESHRRNYKAGEPSVVVTAHYGNWEALGLAGGLALEQGRRQRRRERAAGSQADELSAIRGGWLNDPSADEAPEWLVDDWLNDDNERRPRWHPPARLFSCAAGQTARSRRSISSSPPAAIRDTFPTVAALAATSVSGEIPCMRSEVCCRCSPG
jgi:hypothetical protein